MTRTLTLDFATGRDPHEPGTILYGARNHWRILAAEAVESRVWPYRWRYTVEPLGAHGGDIPAGGHRVFNYRRGEGPADHFGPPPA